MIEIKMTGQLFNEIKQDLARRHPFAAERVGFVFGKTGSLSGEGKSIILTRYHPIPDDHYEADDTVGARIGSAAMKAAMHSVFQGRPVKEGIFHIHIHDHLGRTRMSWVDAHGLPPMVPGFQAMGRQAAHGIIILSRDHGSGWVWLPGHNQPIHSDAVTVIGTPIGVYRKKVAK